MFFVVTVYMLAIFNQIQTFKGHDQQLQNVAYSKTVTLSSQYPDRGYEGWKASPICLTLEERDSRGSE